MDSPSDLSPNAPPSGFDESVPLFYSNVQGLTPSLDQKSADGSVDSSGFEKVEHDVLEEYGNQFANQMQQSIFGNSSEDPFKTDMLAGEEAGDTVKIDDVPLSPEHHVVEKRSVDEDLPNFENQPVEDLISGLEESSQAIVDDALKKAEAVLTDDFLGSEQFSNEPVAHAVEFLPPTEISEVPQDVDDLVQLQESDQFPDIVSSLVTKSPFDDHHHQSDVSSHDDEPNFHSQTPEEVPYERSGPLTIPELPEKLEGLVERAEEDSIPEPDIEPVRGISEAYRAPTPPQVNIVSEAPSLSFREPPRFSEPAAESSAPPTVSKSSNNSGEAWFDFKTIDPRGSVYANQGGCMSTTWSYCLQLLGKCDQYENGWTGHGEGGEGRVIRAGPPMA
ncbi:unnamed protein product [Auanema sp. JU1783]|nr:unnamed protein product [Auanema sp. JU1783]